ncbi:fimbrial protein [Escherichia coli]|nr:fimbrial protein [Escherichia coli]
MSDAKCFSGSRYSFRVQELKPLLFHNWPVLALQSSAAGSAQNVGIQILDRTGEVLILDGATFSAKTDLIDGTNILPFQARYIALGQSVAGTANADATFKVQYL